MVTRREIIGAVAGAGVVGGGLIAATGSTTAVSNVGFVAKDVTAEGDGGYPESVWMKPTLAVTWSGFNEPIETITVEFQRQTADGWTTLHTETFSSVSGSSWEHQFSQITIVTPESPSGPQSGTTSGEETVRAKVTVSSATKSATSVEPATFVWTNKDTTADATVNAEANTGVTDA